MVDGVETFDDCLVSSLVEQLLYWYASIQAQNSGATTIYSLTALLLKRYWFGCRMALHTCVKEGGIVVNRAEDNGYRPACQDGSVVHSGC